MKLLKAIEILEINALEPGSYLPPDYLSALKLGIVALKRIEHCRKWSHYAVKEPLPGETPEEQVE